MNHQCKFFGLRLLCFLLLILPALFPANATPVTALAFSPDGSALVSNGSKCIDLRSPKDGSAQKRVPCDLAKITSIVFHPRGGLLAVAGGVSGVRGEVWFLDWR